MFWLVSVAFFLASVIAPVARPRRTGTATNGTGSGALNRRQISPLEGGEKTVEGSDFDRKQGECHGQRAARNNHQDASDLHLNSVGQLDSAAGKMVDLATFRPKNSPISQKECDSGRNRVQKSRTNPTAAMSGTDCEVVEERTLSGRKNLKSLGVLTVLVGILLLSMAREDSSSGA